MSESVIQWAIILHRKVDTFLHYPLFDTATDAENALRHLIQVGKNDFLYATVERRIYTGEISEGGEV